MVILGIVGIAIFIGLIILASLLVSERYKLLRQVGKFPKYQERKTEEKDHSKPIYKKFLRHKYSKGTAYDRSKMRTNRFQKNYSV
jgi:hypothetical protein